MSSLRSTTNYTYNNNHSNELSIVKYSLYHFNKKNIMHTLLKL